MTGGEEGVWGNRVRFLAGHVGLSVVLVVLWLTVLTIVPRAAFGWKPVAVTSGSMQPSIRPGDLVLAAPNDGARLRPGDVVVFRSPAGPGLVTHRVRSRTDTPGTYVTAGDANRGADSTPLAAEQVVGVGRLVLPVAGLPTVWARTGAWHQLVLAGLGFALAAWCSRFAITDLRGVPFRPSRRVGLASRVRQRPVLPLLVVVGLMGAGAIAALPAGARFGMAGANGGDSWAARSVFGLRMASGTYVGGTTDNRAIAGVGFRPDLVLVKCSCGLAGAGRTTTMVGDLSKVLGATTALAPDLIQSLDADGFTVGTDTKVNGGVGRTYTWVAMQAGNDLKLGSYLGDGTDNRSIAGLGFQPAWVLTMADGDDSMVRPATLAGDASFPIDGTTSAANRLQALQADGFQVGTHSSANASGRTYHYVAWRSGANVKQGTYAGNGVDNRSITGVGFQPRLVWVKRDGGSQAVWRVEAVAGDNSLFWGATGTAADRIQAFETAGFQLGTNAQVNGNGVTYHYLALKDAGS